MNYGAITKGLHCFTEHLTNYPKPVGGWVYADHSVVKVSND